MGNRVTWWNLESDRLGAGPYLQALRTVSSLCLWVLVSPSVEWVAFCLMVLMWESDGEVDARFLVRDFFKCFEGGGETATCCSVWGVTGCASHLGLCWALILWWDTGCVCWVIRTSAALYGSWAPRPCPRSRVRADRRATPSSPVILDKLNMCPGPKLPLWKSSDNILLINQVVCFPH